jgi:hypothetical protein
MHRNERNSMHKNHVKNGLTAGVGVLGLQESAHGAGIGLGALNLEGLQTCKGAGRARGISPTTPFWAFDFRISLVEPKPAKKGIKKGFGKKRIKKNNRTLIIPKSSLKRSVTALLISANFGGAIV